MLYARVAPAAPLFPSDLLLDYKIPEEISAWVAPGSLLSVPFRGKETWALVFECSDKSDVEPTKLRFANSLLFEAPIFDSQHLDFLKKLSAHYIYPLGEVCDTAIPRSIKKKSAKTLKRSSIAQRARAPENAEFSEGEFKLSQEQERCLTELQSSSFKEHLLWGVTGSGKTELYIQRVKEVIALNKTALILVPEISLTPQLVERFRARFGDSLAVFHSKQKELDLRKAWLDTYYGHAKIIVGARSALFAPLKNLGLIVVDEEHDSSYKQDDRLRYDAREAVNILASLYGAKIIYGSATPSAETLSRAFDKKIGLSKLENRAQSFSKLPLIEVIDLKKNIPLQNKDPQALASSKAAVKKLRLEALPECSENLFFSPILLNGIEETLKAKKQGMIFLNRRGVGSQVYCMQCGNSPSCPLCSIRLIPHSTFLSCHYCGYEDPYVKACAHCEAPPIKLTKVGIGTEAVESQLKKHFPEMRAARLDRDSIKTLEDLNLPLDKFRAKELDFLIGTQMLAKGHDFPNLTFVGILLADIGLSVPDFRTFEKSYQLLLQVSGRAGRGFEDGKVLLQTFQPEHAVIKAIQNYRGLSDYEVFVRDELEKRKALNYPPYGELALIRFDGADPDKCSEAAWQLQRGLAKNPSRHVKVLGPAPAPIFKIRERFRYHLLLKSTSSTVLEKICNWILEVWHKERLEKKYRTRLTLDRSPQNML